MATVCDACKATTSFRTGRSKLEIEPPKLTSMELTAIAIKGIETGSVNIPEQDKETLDLCITCTHKALLHLGIGKAEAQPASAPPPGGALTSEDLRELGIEPPRDHTVR
jgi:hypothetical protein